MSKSCCKIDPEKQELNRCVTTMAVKCDCIAAKSKSTPSAMDNATWVFFPPTPGNKNADNHDKCSAGFWLAFKNSCVHKLKHSFLTKSTLTRLHSYRMNLEFNDCDHAKLVDCDYEPGDGEFVLNLHIANGQHANYFDEDLNDALDFYSNEYHPTNKVNNEDQQLVIHTCKHQYILDNYRDDTSLLEHHVGDVSNEMNYPNERIDSICDDVNQLFSQSKFTCEPYETTPPRCNIQYMKSPKPPRKCCTNYSSSSSTSCSCSYK